MNTKDFVKILRSVIREEVRSAVREELKVLTENRIPAKQVIQSKPRQVSAPSKSITGNPILDQVLSETKLTSDFRQTADVGYDDFGSFTSNNIQSMQPPTSMMDYDIEDNYESPLPEMNPSMPFMKDYSQLMKKADQISSQKQF